MFLPYQSKPITRMAYKITNLDNISYAPNTSGAYLISPTGFEIAFKAYEEPKPGDYVVRLTEEDTYHCSRDVFLERNIVEDDR